MPKITLKDYISKIEIAESSEFTGVVLHRKSDNYHKWERGTGDGER